MEIKKLQIENFTQFTDLTVELASSVTIFIGNNGAGKTSLLRAVATPFWIRISKMTLPTIARHRSPRFILEVTRLPR
ncbi:hypothetical protein PN36_01845 [Candidatus Thiomargarita nelsonii]|uniref:Endonuclease GajA/Old nuclease/RecF-like AAA domain-containing protein n=1 Tax=Candidatus Thiomargarita nelsonii TaxID=1003181 RepID=A0A4E0QSU2_9GAMM|nr:hypothetical protein PN36_01845 [Candidatus Thiomargarita nelsonii]